MRCFFQWPRASCGHVCVARHVARRRSCGSTDAGRALAARQRGVLTCLHAPVCSAAINVSLHAPVCSAAINVSLHAPVCSAAINVSTDLHACLFLDHGAFVGSARAACVSGRCHQNTCVHTISWWQAHACVTYTHYQRHSTGMEPCTGISS
jgi:hypothetical protein